MGEETKQEEAKPAETKVEEKKEEEKKDEEKKEEKKDEDKKEEEKKEEEKKEEEATPPPPPPPPPVILSVDLHCLGCAKKIERCLLKCKGVEEVEIDMGQDQLKIKGVVDPQALCSRIQKKTLRSAKVISPVLPPPEEADSAKPQVVASQVSGVTTVELHVNMHCEACAQQLRRKILKMRGVQAAETDLSSGKVMVTGTMTGDKIADYIYRRTGKLAKVIPPPPPPPPPEEEKKDEGEKKPEYPKPEEAKKEEKPAEEKKEENAEKKEDEKSPPDGKKEEGGEEAKKEGDQLAQANMQYTGPDPDMFKRMMYWNNGGGGYYNDSYMGEDNYNYYGKRMPMPWVAPGVPAVYVIERPPPPPQLFSDENPNACCIS